MGIKSKALWLDRGIIKKVVGKYDALPRETQIQLFMLTHVVMDVLQTKIGAKAADWAKYWTPKEDIGKIRIANQHFWRNTDTCTENPILAFREIGTKPECGTGYLSQALYFGLSLDFTLLRLVGKKTGKGVEAYSEI